MSNNTLYLPHATALRMGKLGYQSSAQENLVVSYNDLPSYVRSLQSLLTRKHPDYEALGTHDNDGHWQQLSTALLQIENEFYSTVRPKQPIKSGEAPLRALVNRGIEYVEIRSLDVNPFLPLGIDEQQVRFLDLFLLYCLLQPSPPLDTEEYQQSQQNLARVVDAGRAPNLVLQQRDQAIPLQQWADDICTDLSYICQRISDPEAHYTNALTAERAKVADSTLTPSSRILSAMEQDNTAWFHFAMDQSTRHAETFAERPLAGDTLEKFTQAASASRAQQAIKDAQKEPSFDDFLRDYYAQYQQV